MNRLKLRSIDEFLNLVNGSFGGLYGLKGPSKEELERLKWIVKEMYEKAGQDSMAQHLKGKKMPEEGLFFSQTQL